MAQKKHPVYRVVVADGRCTRDGRYIEQVGRYNPNTDPSEITLDLEKVADWMAKGRSAYRHRCSPDRYGQEGS